MANTYTLIASTTVGSGGASSIDFTSIPATFTDLVLKTSLRDDYTGANYRPTILRFNGVTTSYSEKYVYGTGTGSGASASDTSGYIMYENTDSTTSQTFSNNEIYIPNYAGSNNKSYSSDSVTETNATDAIASLHANLWSNTSAINRITIYAWTGNSFKQHSSAYLYGIKSS